MNLKQIEKSKLFQDDWNNCTVIASSIAFNLDYDKTSRFYTLHGRKWRDGLYHCDTDRIIKLLAEQEGYEVDFFAFDKHEAKRLKGVYNWKRGKFIKRPYFQRYKFQADKKNPMDLMTLTHNLTPNNQHMYLERGNYILGCQGHVLAVKNGFVEDWTEGRKHRINKIWKITKTGKKVKPLTFSEYFNNRERLL